MRQLRIEKITLNVGAGKDQGRLEKGIKLLKMLTGVNPVKTTAKKRIPTWGLRPGLPIGCKLTLRGKKAEGLLKDFLVCKENVLKMKQFDNSGNVSFGIPEYIDIPNVKYDPDIGIMGFEVCLTIGRPGFRVKRRRLRKRKVPLRHVVSKEETIKFLQEDFKIKVLAEGEEE